ncbi:hypothetical protein POX_g09172 [Penicillium oxalicum]|uniref:hypothetical protein n=1 Tax=Penicillium oxalicum TaxID=69781 RepID=UPI0020B6912E|nr:hypothetical protein POX_g09172 [Penicillium oxalicum]KAI2786778.1 hypothetical protein POX_g09172 [Penicillium oxalicum]
MFFLKSHLAVGLLSLSVAATSWIVPGAVWTDTKGQKIDAHGGGIVKVGSTFYWSGQSASNAETPYMYSSTDLLNWTPLGAQAKISGMWRPKIAKPNGNFWIYGQVNRLVQPLESSRMVGGYQPHGSGEHLLPSGYTYSDTGMFQDPKDGTWYILTSADHNNVQINKINSDGTVGNRVGNLAAGAYEAPGMFYADGTYYLIVSGKTGWRGNPNQMFYSNSLSGPWNGPHSVAPGSSNTYGAQNTFELVIKGTKQTTYIYMGDLWDSHGGPSSNYLWLPMSVDTSAKSVTLNYHSMWAVDVNTGEIKFPSTKKRHEAEEANLFGRAAISVCDHCLTKKSVHKIDHESEVVFENVTGTGVPEWVSFHYTVNDPTAGEACIYVNGQPALNISDMNSYAGYHQTVPVQLTLQPGDTNTIKFAAVGSSDFEVSLDGIELHE